MKKRSHRPINSQQIFHLLNREIFPSEEHGSLIEDVDCLKDYLNETFEDVNQAILGMSARLNKIAKLVKTLQEIKLEQSIE